MLLPETSLWCCVPPTAGAASSSGGAAAGRAAEPGPPSGAHLVRRFRGLMSEQGGVVAELLGDGPSPTLLLYDLFSAEALGHAPLPLPTSLTERPDDKRRGSAEALNMMLQRLSPTEWVLLVEVEVSAGGPPGPDGLPEHRGTTLCRFVVRAERSAAAVRARLGCGVPKQHSDHLAMLQGAPPLQLACTSTLLLDRVAIQSTPSGGDLAIESVVLKADW